MSCSAVVLWTQRLPIVHNLQLRPGGGQDRGPTAGDCRRLPVFDGVQVTASALRGSGNTGCAMAPTGWLVADSDCRWRVAVLWARFGGGEWRDCG